MGVLIEVMEMPETCKLCYLSEFNPGFYAYVCKPTGIRIDYDIAKIDRPRTICPLVPVPPHGRFGDLDKLEKMFADIDSAPYSCFDGAEPFYSAEDAVHIIRLAPTIIPASEEGET